MRYFRLFLSILFACLWIIAGCQPSAQSVKEKAFVELVGEVEMNQTLHLKEPAESNTNKIGDKINLTLGNTSGDYLQIDLYKDLKIYTYSSENKQWTEIQNIEIYEYTGQYEQNLIFLPSTKSDQPLADITIDPELFGYKDPIEIRIVIIGEKFGNVATKGEKTGAYVNVSLTP